MNFITRSTKVTSIVASVLTALLLITLVMLASLIPLNKEGIVLMTFIYTISLMLILLLWQGILQIRVFNDYKCQKGMLCADGILSICMGALIIISAVLFGTLQAYKVYNGVSLGNTADIRIFLVCFLLGLAIWKLVTTIYSIKEKHFNWWCELIDTILWFALGITCLISIFMSNIITIAWVIIGIAWAIICLNIFYMLFSYVIRKPNYLETERAIEIYNEEQEAKNVKQNKIYKSLTVEDKLLKLKQLYENDLITITEYKNKKDKLLNDNL